MIKVYQPFPCCSISDSSKQRSRLRGKLTASKAELKECVDGLKLLHPDNVINLQAIEQGTFPWQEESRQSKWTEVNVPWGLKPSSIFSVLEK